ncbi:glycosyltransferase family 4 protein [Ramlibacter sp. AN1015]|uniref:glycosyltransferase family 4 protein n=1 Tax=Ramlibacter sp. AN1015 TaxID=3133428 RepID=UPI0030C39F6E
MHVVIVNDFAFVNGGAGMVALSSACALAERGHRVIVFAAVAGEQGGIAAMPGVQLICTNQPDLVSNPSPAAAALQGIWNRTAQVRMGELLERLPARDTVVHFHGWTKALSPSVIAQVAAQKFPAIATLHEYFSACPNGGFFNYQSNRSCDKAPLGMSCLGTHCDSRSYPRKLWRVARQVVQQRVSRFPGGLRHFIAVSTFSTDILQPYLPSDARIHHVPNPIVIRRPQLKDRAPGDHFVCVGRLSPEKGVELFARATGALGVPTRFVGDGPLRGAVLKANPAAAVTGWLNAPEAQLEIARARALVLPSLWYETQGMVVDEAAALGVPAIVSDGSAARDRVVDGKTGLWFRCGDEADLTDKLRALAGDPSLAATMGAHAYEQFWRDPPTLQRHVSGLEAAYSECLSDR